MLDLIEEKEFELACQDGKKRTYIISKFPATVGREILAKYSGSALPKIGEYDVNHEMMTKLMSYVSAKTSDGKLVRLVNSDYIDNHVKSTIDLFNIEDQMFYYNYGFFLKEKVLNFFDAILEMVRVKLQEMSMASSRPL